MNDPHDDIQAYLTAQGYLNVFVDGFVVFPYETDANYNQINVQSEPSSTEIEVGYRKITFGIYVKNRSKEIARFFSKKIRKLLLNNGGKLVADTNSVVFKKIWVATEPYFWSLTQNNENIYLTRYQAMIRDTEIDTVYNN